MISGMMASNQGICDLGDDWISIQNLTVYQTLFNKMCFGDDRIEAPNDGSYFWGAEPFPLRFLSI